MVTTLGWVLTLAAVAGLLVLDLLVSARRSGAISFGQAVGWSLFYIAVALAFGVVLGALAGWDLGTQYFAGYVVEKSLSIDNLFTFVIVISTFAVPAEHQSRALTIGIVVALIREAARCGRLALRRRPQMVALRRTNAEELVLTFAREHDQGPVRTMARCRFHERRATRTTPRGPPVLLLQIRRRPKRELEPQTPSGDNEQCPGCSDSRKSGLRPDPYWSRITTSAGISTAWA